MISDTAVAVQARRRARYTALKLSLMVLVGAAVITSLILLLLTAQQIRNQSIEAVKQRAIVVQEQADIKALLLRNQRTDKERASVIDAAVKRIDISQRSAISSHNDAAIALLRKIEADLQALRSRP